MTTPVHADPRRSGAPAGLGFAESASGDGSALDMPVLFQLSDLSQIKVLSPPAKPKPQHQPTAKSSAEAESAAAVSSKSESADPLPAGEVNASPKKDATTAVTAGEVKPANIERPLLAAAVAAAELSAAAPPDSPTIRERAQLRERRRQAATQGDWFQTQGKYILVVFLVLLVGTIYVARRGGDDSPPSPTIDPADLAAETPELSPREEPQLEQPQLAAESNDFTPAEVIADAPAFHPTDLPLAESSPADALTAEDSPAVPVDQYPAAESAPQITLQAPLQDEPQQPAADGSLFPWANQPEPRVATRPAPETQGSSVPLPQANPHFPGRQYAPGSVGAAPQQPANAPPEVYPSTGIEGATLPEAAMPADAATPAVYPVVDPAPPRSSSVQPPRSAAGTGTMPASYENRIPPAPRTSGPRYERTGSGLY